MQTNDQKHQRNLCIISAVKSTFSGLQCCRWQYGSTSSFV